VGSAFNRIWASSVVSNLADGVMIAAVPLLAISLTDNPVLIVSKGENMLLFEFSRLSRKPKLK
jgi:hypothetical protein